MTNAQITKSVLAEMMDRHFDRCLFAHGFSRRKNASVYTRKIADTTQRIMIQATSSPINADRSIIALILPVYAITYPEVNRIAAEMLGEEKPRDYTLKHQVHTLSKPVSWWYYREEYSIDEIACEIADFFDRTVLPFLDDYASVQGFIGCYQAGDKRFPYTHGDYIFPASAYVCTGQPEKGLAVLEKHLSKPGLRRQYAKAWEYFAEV